MKTIIKNKRYFITLFPLLFSFLNFIACGVDDVPPRTEPTKLDLTKTDPAYLHFNVPRKTIFNTSASMEYSLDNGNNWLTCTSALTLFEPAVGQQIRVRRAIDADSGIYLGSITALDAPDLTPGPRLFTGIISGNYWTDQYTAKSGDTISIYHYFGNIGTQKFYNTNFKLSYYISTDTNITSSDTLLKTTGYPYTCNADFNDSNYIQTDVTIPTLTPGKYYIGCIIDSTNAISEINEANNITMPSDAVEFTINDSASITGACKIVNSWGTGSNWQKKSGDGHYWLTYDAIIKMKLPVYYYYNEYTTTYQPTMIAVFNITHSKRSNLQITIGLGNSDYPYLSKTFNIASVQSSTNSFPSYDLALDISEFAYAINDFNAFIKVENSGSSSGSINKFNIELYNTSDHPYNTSGTNYLKLYQGGSKTIGYGSNKTTTLFCATLNSINAATLNDIQPTTRYISNESIVSAYQPSLTEELSDMRLIGVYNEDTSYNQITETNLGTGLQPPTREEWDTLQKLAPNPDSSLGTVATNSSFDITTDATTSKYFPPIGNQGSKGSCAAFACGYYIQTYTEAKEHSWDLTGTVWSDILYAPTTNKNLIFSPDFLFNQANSGNADAGSSPGDVINLIINQGGVTWDIIPYSQTNTNSWGNALAWRTAPLYRGRQVNTGYFGDKYGYFIVDDYSDINMITTLISQGYIMCTAVCAGDKSSSGNIFYFLDSNDVINASVTNLGSFNHAQTIVGYKQGSNWNSSSPD